jgi:hypothetical protein
MSDFHVFALETAPEDAFEAQAWVQRVMAK